MKNKMITVLLSFLIIILALAGLALYFKYEPLDDFPEDKSILTINEINRDYNFPINDGIGDIPMALKYTRAIITQELDPFPLFVTPHTRYYVQIEGSSQREKITFQELKPDDVIEVWYMSSTTFGTMIYDAAEVTVIKSK
ncbi:hypothetical protein [Paenibacillus camelliae]|uniref:hypothetical protein n=1 Tax=Paenibacillus camelliae TaxID=512410 RepID=UPI00204136DD|nr:hypothetical protein [Paenibacillus camelliae]MCM3631893.1 hypothetical protein [Paenibacillus camelliae]